MRVRVGRRYRYLPVFIDISNPPYGVNRIGIMLKPGDIVTVRNLPMAPPADTMGHCYIFKGSEFAGMVSTNSLQPVNPSRRKA